MLVAYTAVGNVFVWAIWVVTAAACLGTGVLVVTRTNPFHSALALIGNLGSLAVLYLLLSAEFVAAAQILVYAGAVMVMFLFVIAYLGGRADAPWIGGRTVHQAASVVASLAILGVILAAIALKAGGNLGGDAEIDKSFGSPEEVGRLFLTDHLLAFEVTSIVLLVAAVGGVVLGSHARRAEAEAKAARLAAATTTAPPARTEEGA